MNDHVNEQLRVADPIVHEDGLSAPEVDVLRRAIVTAATDGHHARWSPGRLALATAVAFMLALGVVIDKRFELASEQSTQPQANEPRQLQFETPGGTRSVRFA